MTVTNKHGLPRRIPDSVKKEVRTRCGYGCVVCGSVPYEYDHFHVPFAEAKEHLADDIILLCDKHHKQKGNELVDIEWIEKAIKIRAMDKEGRFKIEGTNPSFAVHWPSANIEASHHAILIDGKPVLSVRTQEDELEPVVLNGTLSDLNGQRLCTIEENEIVWKAVDIGDFTAIKNRFTYTSRSGRKCLDFSLSNAGLQITEIFHVNNGVAVFGNNRCLRLSNGKAIIDVTGITSLKGKVAFSLRSNVRRDYSNVDIESMPHNIRLLGATSNNTDGGIIIDEFGNINIRDMSFYPTARGGGNFEVDGNGGFHDHPLYTQTIAYNLIWSNAGRNRNRGVQ